ncbi:MAG: tetratricopeptide repeat protein [Deltaproteobacteria bacterium]|nr:tetratricopeptide repeat protein [Deltaproteobacteria bacterium]
MSELEKYQQIFERDPTDLQAFNNVCHAAEKAQDYEYLTELLKYRTQITGDQAEIVDLLFRAGVVYIEKMNDLARGVEVLLQAFDIDQAHAGIGARLVNAYVDAGDYAAALAIVEGRLNAIGNADIAGTQVSIRSDLHFQAGEILQDRLGDTERALTHYRKAIELDKSNASALARAREIYLGLSKFKNAAKLCELEARLEKDSGRKILLYRELANILGNQMGDKTQAVTALKRALKADQNNDDVKLELATTIADSRMEPANAKDHKWASDYLTKRAKHTGGDDGLRFGCLAVRAYPTSEKALAIAGARARELRAFQPLIDECKAAYSSMGSLEEQAPLIRRIVKSYLRMGSMNESLVWAEKLEQVANEKDRALIAKLKEAASHGGASLFDSEVPDSPSSFLSGPPSMVPGAADFESRPAPTISEPPPALAVSIPMVPPTGIDLDEWIAQMHQEAENARRSGEDDLAEQIMRAIIDHQPGDQKATTYLERRYRGTENWHALRQLLLQCVSSDDFPPAVKTVRLRQAAKLAEENLNDVNGAIETWYQIKAHDPKVRDARDALERLLAETGRWEELVELYKEEIENTSSRSKKVAAWQHLAEIYRIRLSNAEKAAEALQNIIELAPDDNSAVEALDELYLREQMYDRLVPLLDKRAKNAHDKVDRKNLILRAASVLQERLGHFEEAYEKAKSILDFLPGDLGAIEAMEAVDEESENWERLVETLNLKARVTKDKADKVAAYKKVATIASARMEDGVLSLKAWNKVLEVDPADDEALDTTIELYETAGEWTELVRILKLRIDSSDSDSEKVELYRKLAKVLDSELKNPEEAVSHWHALLKIEDDVEALRALSKWHESRDEWYELTQVLSQLAPLLEDHVEKSDVLFQRAKMFYDKLGQKDKAIEELKAIQADVNPAHVPTLGLLRDVLAKAGNFEEAAEVLEQQIGYTQDKEELRQFQILLGNWSRKELSDLNRAMAAYEKAAAMDINDEAVLDTLDEIFVEAEEWDKLLKMMYGRYQRSEDEDVRYGYLLRGGQLCEEKLEDNKQAWGWYRQIFEQMREHDGAMETVEEAGHRMSLWKELIDVFGKMTQVGTDDEKVSWWMKIAAVFEEKLDEPGQALEAVLRAFGLDPDNEEMLDSVDRLAVMANAWERLATVYAVLAKRTEELEARIEILMRHARVLHENAQESGMAFDVALKAFELNPQSVEILRFVEEVGRASLRFNDLVKVYKVCADRAEPKEIKVELLLRSANVYRNNMDDGDGALDRALDALVVSPFNEDVVAKVWEFVREMEADLVEAQKGAYWAKMVEVYRQLADAHRRDATKQVELTLVISKIYAEELHENTRAFDALKEAQELAPGDENTIDMLEDMAGELNLWEDLVEHYRDILDETFEMSTAVMYHRRRARILAEHLDQLDEAAEHYWQIIQLDAQDERAYAELLQYYETAEKWNDLVNLLERQLDAASNDDKRQELLLQIADIWENRIGNKYEAKDWYEQVTALWPDNTVAKEALERLASADKVGGYDDDTDADMQELVSISPPLHVEKETAANASDATDDSVSEESSSDNAEAASNEEMVGDTDDTSDETDADETDSSEEPEDDMSALDDDEDAVAGEADEDVDDSQEVDDSEDSTDETDEPAETDTDESVSDAEDTKDDGTDSAVDAVEALNDDVDTDDMPENDADDVSAENCGDDESEEFSDEDSMVDEAGADDEADSDGLEDADAETINEVEEEADDMDDAEADEETEEADAAGEEIVVDTEESTLETSNAEASSDEPESESGEGDSGLFFNDTDDSDGRLEVDSDEVEVEEDDLDSDAGVPRPPAPPKPPLPPRPSGMPGGISVAPPPPPVRPSMPNAGVPRPPSIPAPPSITRPPAPPSVPGIPGIPSPPKGGSLAPPPPPPPKSRK